MNNYIDAARKYVTSHKKQFILGAEIVLGVGIVAVLIILVAVSANQPKYKYSPVKACDLLTSTEAQDLLGDKVIAVDANNPVVSIDTATSKCSYTDMNQDANAMLVAAVAVRSPINDKGIEQNKDNFAAGKPSNNVEDIKGLGDSAYFNHQSGQMNILSKGRWIIISYGTGADPAGNTIENAVKLAHKVL